MRTLGLHFKTFFRDPEPQKVSLTIEEQDPVLWRRLDACRDG